MNVFKTSTEEVANIKGTTYAFRGGNISVKPKQNIINPETGFTEYAVVIDDGYHYPVTIRAVDKRDMLTMVRVLKDVLN